MNPCRPAFPVDTQLASITAQLATHQTLLLTAEPGAGKTTRVPLALLAAPWLAGQQIIMLEPRRLAARNAAVFMASQLGEAAGEQVGYRVRLDSKESARTRILIVTEGILTRMLQDDPELTGVGLVIFDEFHERHLNSDLALALAHQCQQLLRPDLKLLIMSATLDTDELSQRLQAPLLHCPGQGFPVTLDYRPPQSANESLSQHASRVIHEALQRSDGHLLVFLPGVADIRRLGDELERRYPQNNSLDSLKVLPIQILPLHGQLSEQQQKQALAELPAGQRKIILATNIAESSLTLNGVTCVVDSGLERRMEFSPTNGLSELKTRPISQASATQRMGRAGRQQSGHCYRLWPESTHQQRPPHIEAELLNADLASLLLELLLWGAEVDELLWLDSPPTAALNQARSLLHGLGYLSSPDSNVLSEHGQQCARLGIEPRWASALVAAQQQGQARPAAELIALLQQWPHQQRRSDDVERLWNASRSTPLWQQRVAPLAQRWLKCLPVGTTRVINGAPVALARWALLAFPERLARCRSNSSAPGTGNTHNALRYLMASGSGAELHPNSDLIGSPWLVVLDLSGAGNHLIRLAIAIEESELAATLAANPHWLSQHTVVQWQSQGNLLAEEQSRIGELIWRRRKLDTLGSQQWQQVWRDYFNSAASSAVKVQQRLASLNWNAEATQLRQRLLLLHNHDQCQSTAGGWPDVSDQGLLARLDDWLLPYLDGCRNERQLQQLNLVTLLTSLLDWPQQQQLEQQAPTHWQVASGSRIRIDYTETPPVLAVKLQEMFGYPQQPAVLSGRLALKIQLLSPGQKPLQVTQDLPHFWRHGYAEVRKEMRGRYPKHPWPEDPLSAEATALTKAALARRQVKSS